MKLISTLLRTTVAASCIALLMGCGGGDEKFQAAPASGKVTYNGEAVKGGSLTLTPVAPEGGKSAGKPATATVGDDGTFTLSTYGTDDGAVVGRHRVSYSPPSSSAEAPADGHGQAPPSPYAGLHPKQEEVEITEGGTNELTIELTK